MVRKIVALVLLGILGLSAELWINVIQDPGAELGAGDWETDVWELPEGMGIADSVQVDAHDSSRVYEGDYSFLTDTDKDPGIDDAQCDVWCYQSLKIPKAVRDIDSCEWAVYMDAGDPFRGFRFYISFRSQNRKTLLWFSGNGSSEGQNDTLYSLEFPLPETGEWLVWGDDPHGSWINEAGWSEFDTIIEVHLVSKGENEGFWVGQEVSWDNIVLEGIAYYDYAAESIDSDETADEHYTPVATFANEGIKDDQPGMVYAEILDGETSVYIDSQEVDIPHESSEQVTFAEWTVPHDGSYTLRVYTILELDEYSTDDTLELVLTGLGVDEPVTHLDDLALEVVGTSRGVLKVSFETSNGQVGNLSVYEATGRRIERMEVTRSGSVEFNSALASGVYLVRLESKQATVTKKAVVLR